MTARVKYGTFPLTRLTNRSVSVLTMSPRTVQHRQPLLSSTTSSVALSTNRWSRPISPNSLTMTAVAAIPGCFKTWFSSVVLPLPRNPVSTVTGMRDKALLAGTVGSSWLDRTDFPAFRGGRREFPEFLRPARLSRGRFCQRLLLRPAGEVASEASRRGKRRPPPACPLHHASHGPPPRKAGEEPTRRQRERKSPDRGRDA